MHGGRTSQQTRRPLPEEPTVEVAAQEISQLIDQVQQTGATTRGEHARLKRTLRSRGALLERASRERYQAARTDPDPLHRWTLLAALGQLRAPELTAFYDEVAAEPLPPRDAEEGHGAFGRRDMEIMIRMRAIEALRDLAAERHPAALTALLDKVKTPQSPTALLRNASHAHSRQPQRRHAARIAGHAILGGSLDGRGDAPRH